MKIAGLVKSSLIDYPGKIAAVVFTQGCNFRCGFCHNPDLISTQFPDNAKHYGTDEILDFLTTRVGRLDGVVVTGGEPLIQADIESFIIKIKELGYCVKLDTNGSNPDKLEALIKAGLIDYIAMDIKGPLAKYDEICVYPNKKVIQRSVKLIMDSGCDYEFRTTVLPAYHDINDFIKIGELIKGAKRFTIQGFRPQITLDPELTNTTTFKGEDLKEIQRLIKPFVGEVSIHDNI